MAEIKVMFYMIFINCFKICFFLTFKLKKNYKVYLVRNNF